MLPYDSISGAIVAHHLMTPMSSALCVRVTASAAEVLEALTPHNFDQAPVTNGMEVVGFVTRVAAEAMPPGARIRVQRLTSPYLVSANAPIATLIRRLVSSPMVFAVEADGLAGFVTPSDLNKHPVRTYFYLLLADLEMTMASEGRETLSVPRDSLQTLSKRRCDKVLERYEEAQEFNVDADVLTAFEFSDLLTMTQRTGLHRRFGFETPTSWRRATRGLTSFRDHVMHPTSDFIGKRTIEDLIGIEDQLRGMLLAVDNR